MPVPTYDQFIEPLLRYLAAHSDGAAISDVCETLANGMKLTPEDRAEMLPSGAQAVYRNRIGWAHDRLKRAELSSSPRRGFWKLTSEGLSFASKNKSISDDALERLSSVDRTSRLKPKKDALTDTPSTPTLPGPASERSSPEERIESALTELRASVARDLLGNIGSTPPAFFEH